MNHQKGQGISVRLRQFADCLICSTRTIIFICLVWSKKKETRAQPLSRHFLANKKQAIVNRFYEFYRAFCRLHVFALSSDWLSFAAHGEIKAKQKKEFAFLLIGHFRVPKPSLSKWGQVYNLSCENEFYSNEDENHFLSKAEHLTSFWYKGSGNTEMACLIKIIPTRQTNAVELCGSWKWYLINGLTCSIHECRPKFVRKEWFGQFPEEIFEQSAHNVNVFNFALWTKKE